MSKTGILLLQQEPFPCIPVRSSFSLSSVAPTACAVILGSEEVPIQAKNFKWLR